MSRDYKPTMGSGARVQKKEGLPAHWIGLAASVALITSIFFLVPDNAKATRADFLENNTQITNAQTSSAQVTSSQITMPLAIPGNTAPGTEAKNNPRSTNASTSNSTSTQKNTVWKTATVKNGDNMALIFSRAGLSPQELYRVMSADKEASVLKHLMPGQKLKFQIDDGALQQLVYKIDALNTLHVKQNPDESFAVSTDTRKMETRVTNTSGVINSSLFLAGQKAGLSDNLIMELAGIFGWDIDFALDIRGGDRFTLVYEELFLDGKKQRDGNIIAAEFNNRGKTYRALRYTDAKGISDYFSPDGKSMRKAFIRTPVDFTRISSRFGKRRHPTLNRMKNHHGVDYAAPRGTPIKAAGDGKLTYVGRKGGYGKTHPTSSLPEFSCKKPGCRSVDPLDHLFDQS